MLSKIDFKPAEAAAFWQLNEMRPSEFEALAEKWLGEGLGGLELSAAAFGLPKTRLDADPIVEKVLIELGVSKFSRKQLGWIVLYACHSRLLDKRWTTYEAARFIIQIANDFNAIPLFDGKDPHMANVKAVPPHKKNADQRFAGEGCRVNGIYCAYYSKDDYSFCADKEDTNYDEFIKRVQKEVEEYILSEANFSWTNYFSLSAILPDEYESLKVFL